VSDLEDEFETHGEERWEDFIVNYQQGRDSSNGEGEENI
jgi:hypothetical protein